MITTQQPQNAPAKAKPSYSLVLYDPLSLTSYNAEEKNEDTATEPSKTQKPPTKTALAEKFKQRKKEFREALHDIYRAGLDYDEAVAKIVETIAVPITNAAIPGLAKILGTYRTYFDNADTVEREKLFGILFQQCKTDFGKSGLIKSDKRTTEWHLLSRIFRRSDRRQASADAKILKFAHNEGVTEQSFASWVKKYGTLSSILKGIPADPSESEIKPKTNRQSKPDTKWIYAAQVPDDDPSEALRALKKLADGKKYTVAIHHHQGRFDIMRLVEINSAEAHSDDKNAVEDHDTKPKKANESIPLLTFDPNSVS